MTFVRSLARSWLPVGVAFLIGATFVGVAAGHGGSPDFLHSGHSDTMNGTLKAKNFKFKSPKTNRLVVPGSAFAPNDCTGFSGEACSNTADNMVAPVNLPQGAVVKRVLWTYDSGAAGDASIHLESNFGDANHDDMSLMNTDACGSSPCTKSDSTISPSGINNARRWYGLWLSPNIAGHSTFRVVIVYTTRSVGPATGLPQGVRAAAGPSGSGQNGN